jgi:hypothetical protein
MSFAQKTKTAIFDRGLRLLVLLLDALVAHPLPKLAEAATPGNQ